MFTFGQEKADLDNQVANLKQQVKILMEKLQEVGGDQAVMEVQEKIKMHPACNRTQYGNNIEYLYLYV